MRLIQFLTKPANRRYDGFQSHGRFYQVRGISLFLLLTDDLFYLCCWSFQFLNKQRDEHKEKKAVKPGSLYSCIYLWPKTKLLLGFCYTKQGNLFRLQKMKSCREF